MARDYRPERIHAGNAGEVHVQKDNVKVFPIQEFQPFGKIGDGPHHECPSGHHGKHLADLLCIGGTIFNE